MTSSVNKRYFVQIVTFDQNMPKSHFWHSCDVCQKPIKMFQHRFDILTECHISRFCGICQNVIFNMVVITVKTLSTCYFLSVASSFVCSKKIFYLAEIVRRVYNFQNVLLVSNAPSNVSSLQKGTKFYQMVKKKRLLTDQISSPLSAHSPN